MVDCWAVTFADEEMHIEHPECTWSSQNARSQLALVTDQGFCQMCREPSAVERDIRRVCRGEKVIFEGANRGSPCGHIAAFLCVEGFASSEAFCEPSGATDETPFNDEVSGTKW